MTGTVTSWTETNAGGQEVVRHGISKTYYTDDTYTTVKNDVDFASFENRFTPDYGSVDFTKVDGAGEPLEGAEFTLYKDEACTIPAIDLDTEGHPVWTASSDSNGKVSFENVRVGTYYMKETTAPSQYALDETVYKVVIEDSKDNTKKSKITILGDEEEIAVTEIANAKTGKITVIKKWLNASGTEIDGGSSSATVWLKRKHMVAEEGGSTGNHTVTVQMTVEDGGVQYGTPVTQTVTGDTVIIEWDDEWQRNFNWSLKVGNKSYEGWIGDEFVTTDNYSFEQISIDGRSRRLTIPHVQGDVSLTTKYWVNWLHSDNNHWNNLNNPVISGIGEEPNYVAEEDTAFNNEKHTQVLSGSTWSHTWNIGGTESSHSGFDYPAMDDNGKNYLYYVVELDAQGNAIEVGGSPLEGYVLQGYSANNNTGVSNQGVIMVYNRAEGAYAINVIIKKTDNAENSTNYLEGAVFKLMYRSGSSGTFTNVSNESVPELNSESKFTVPTAGITLTGLVDGQYQLQEISPPSGYVITNSTPVTFTVSGGAITSTQGTITGVRYTAASETSDAAFIVPNEPGAALPNTGGPGTKLFTILGSILILGAGVLLWRRRRLI
jgi:LPXTG-motif cell wall-anchored protein